MTPRQLKYFVTIARCGSLTTAAAQLHVAQPALSQHVMGLESTLGVPLFDRHARGVTLTPEGQRLLERATSILRQLDSLQNDVLDTHGALNGTVSVCLVESLAAVLTIPLYRHLQCVAPGISLQLCTAISREARALVEARRVDLAILPVAFELPRLEVLPLFEERFHVIGATHWLGTSSAPLRLQEVADLPLAAPDRDHDQRKLIERAALGQSCTLNVRYELNSPSLLHQVVRGGLACTIFARSSFAEQKGVELNMRELIEPSIERTQSLVWMAERPLTPASETVRDLLPQLISQLITDGSLQARDLLSSPARPAPPAR